MAKKKKVTKKKATKKAASRTTAKKKKAPKKDVLVVASKVKEFIKANGLQSSSDVVPALNERIYELLTEATARTEGNRRVTVRACDL